MENPIYLGDAVYAFHDGRGIELRLNDHRAERAVYLEPEVIEALSQFHARMIDPEASAGYGADPKNKAVAEALAYCRAEVESKLKTLERCSGIMERLPERIIPHCSVIDRDLLIYHCTRENVKEIMSSLKGAAGQWTKNVNCSSSDKLDYNCVVDGIKVELWAAAPPESCQIVEETVEVPAHTEIKRTLVCK